MSIIKIPDSEYQERIKKASEIIRERNLDLLIVNSTEADFANARYFSGYWPIFETAGVVITKDGEAALIIGPESEAYAKDVSKISKIFMLKEYRESADPSYPEINTATFKDVFTELGVDKKDLNIGIAGYLVTTVPMYQGLEEEYPNANLTRADDIMVELRSVKSDNEVACLKESFRIAEIAINEVISKIKPGMTELQVVGIAQEAIYRNGAEYEGMPMYVFSGESTRHAISRPTHKKLRDGDIIQLNISARVDGYSSGVGMPIKLGKLTEEEREVFEFGLDAHNWTKKQLREGAQASDIAKGYINFFEKENKLNKYLYGPCHGLGMIEVESPWMETDSDYLLQENMTFQVDTFISAEKFGIRWETGVVITESGYEYLSNPVEKIHEIY